MGSDAEEAESPNRRGRMRVREVSSRFMSPSSNYNSGQISAAQRRQFQAVNSRKWEEVGRSLDSSSTPLPKPCSVVYKENAARPDTPVVRPDPTQGKDRAVSSRYRQTPVPHRPGPAASTSTPAAKLLQDATRDHNHCSRSLTFTCLPPPAPHPRLGKTHTGEDAHSLKLLTNHYLQWRFMNAKAHASTLSNKIHAQGQLYSAAVKLSQMRDSVKRSRCQLQLLRTMQASSTIAQLQMPYLEEWCGLDQHYSTCLSAATDAFSCLSLRLPVGEGVKMCGTEELGELLDSAQNVVEMIVSHTQGYMVNAELVEGLASEIARITGRQRAYIQDCGSCVVKIHAQQVEECCLRGHLIRLHTQHNQNQSSQT